MIPILFLIVVVRLPLAYHLGNPSEMRPCYFLEIRSKVFMFQKESFALPCYPPVLSMAITCGGLLAVSPPSSLFASPSLHQHFFFWFLTLPPWPPLSFSPSSLTIPLCLCKGNNCDGCYPWALSWFRKWPCILRIGDGEPFSYKHINHQCCYQDGFSCFYSSLLWLVCKSIPVLSLNSWIG